MGKIITSSLVSIKAGGIALVIKLEDVSYGPKGLSAHNCSTVLTCVYFPTSRRFLREKEKSRLNVLISVFRRFSVLESRRPPRFI